LVNLALMMINVVLETPISSTTNTNALVENALKSPLLSPIQMTTVTPTLTATTTPAKASAVKTDFARELLSDLHVTMMLNVFTDLSVTQPSTNAKLTSLLELLALTKDLTPMPFAVPTWSVVELKLVSSTSPLLVEPNVTLEANAPKDSPAITELADLNSLLWPVPTTPFARTPTPDISLATADNAQWTSLPMPLATATTSLPSTALPPTNAAVTAVLKLDLASLETVETNFNATMLVLKTKPEAEFAHQAL
jgi:hypothetical protein